VKILPADINLSNWECTLEEAAFEPAAIDFRHGEMREVIKTRHAVRLGFLQIKGVSSDDMEQLVKNRGEGYNSVRDLWLRSGLQKSAIERLADADAFQSIGLSRRQALWAVRALDVKSATEELPLFEQVRHIDLQPEPQAKLPDMLPGEQVIEDYRYLSLSLKAHPVSFLREELRKAGVTRNVDLLRVANGKRVTIAGLVLVRQRPGSASGVIFMTLEDETGVANAIVWPKMFEKYRSVVMGARLVKIVGRLQSQSGVIHTVVEHIEDMTPLLGILQREARRFGVSERSDEVLRPTQDHRQQKKADALARDELVRRIGDGRSPERARDGDLAETASVMPRGRNFH
jgi:DNA polymerase III alpha subunit